MSLPKLPNQPKRDRNQEASHSSAMSKTSNEKTLPPKIVENKPSKLPPVNKKTNSTESFESNTDIKKEKKLVLPESAKEETADTPSYKTASETGAIKEYNAVGKNDIDLGEGWFIDFETKVKYKGIPKLKDKINKGTGRSPGVITDDIDTLNLNAAADIYLAHLKVAPDEKEMEKIRKARAARAIRINEEYEMMWKAKDQDTKE